jgi:monofunctional chorismate mutase
MVKALRGAIQISADEPDLIGRAVIRLYRELISQNELDESQIISMIISQTDDLHTCNPATALRSHGVDGFALFCLQELKIDDQLPRTIRFLVHCELSEEQLLKHVYLDGAARLRPDLLT